jgi:hypothetical protein
VTSGGNYPPGPYPGSYGYPPEGDDSSEQHRRGDHRAYGSDPSEPDAAGSPVSGPPASESPVSGSPVSGSPQAVARAAIRMPGLRVEPPADGQPIPSGPPPAGQVYGRPSATTYGRPSSPAPAAEPPAPAARPDMPPPAPGAYPPANAYPTPGAYPPANAYPTPGAYPTPDADAEPPARPAADARDFAAPGQPRIYGQRQPQNEDSWDGEHDDVPSADQPAWEQHADAPAWEQRSDPRSWEQQSDSRQSEQGDPRSWEQHGDPPAWQEQSDASWEQRNDADAWEHQRDAPSWQQSDDPPAWERDNDPAPADRTPGLYGHAAATSTPAPQPLYGGAPPPPAKADRNGLPPRPPRVAGVDSNGRRTGPPGSADASDNEVSPRPPAATGADSNAHAAGPPSANGPSANAFGPGVYGASVYGAATYGTPRDLGDHDDPVPSDDRFDPASERNGFAGPGEMRYGMARPAEPAPAEDAPRSDGGRINGSPIDGSAVNGSPVNGIRVNGGPMPDAPPARPAGVVYGTPRVYGSPRPTPEDDVDDSPAGFDDRPEPNRFGDRAGSLDDRLESLDDLPARPYGGVPGRAVADMPGRSAVGDGVGRPAEAMDRTRAEDAVPRGAVGRPASMWTNQARPESDAVARDAPTSPPATRVGQTYGSSRAPIDWSVPEQDNHARFDTPVPSGEGVRIPTGSSSFTPAAAAGTGDGRGAAGATDVGPAPEPRRWTRTAGIIAIVVIVIGLAAGALYYTSRPNAPSYQIGSCVQHSGEKVNGSACTAPNSFKIVSKVSDPSACPNANDPHLYLDNDKSTIYCLAPNQ